MSENKKVVDKAGYKILIVDDEEAMCWIVSKFLTNVGYIAFTAQNGEDALDILEKEKPDLMLLDNKMPGLSGAAVLREFGKRNIRIPVIIMSGYEESFGAMDEFKEMGYGDILSKPISLNILLKKVSEVLEKK